MNYLQLDKYTLFKYICLYKLGDLETWLGSFYALGNDTIR